MSRLVNQIKKSAIALKELIDKFEADGYIKCKNDLSVSEFLFNDLIAFLMLPVFCDLQQVGKENAKKYLEKLSECFALTVNEKAFNEFFMQYISRVQKDQLFNEYKDIIPEGYSLIKNFDDSVQKDNGLFYDKLKIENPGRLTDYYIMLIEAARELAETNLGDKTSVTLDFIDASIRIMN